jgi:hypothetical protein
MELRVINLIFFFLTCYYYVVNALGLADLGICLSLCAERAYTYNVSTASYSLETVTMWILCPDTLEI